MAPFEFQLVNASSDETIVSFNILGISAPIMENVPTIKPLFYIENLFQNRFSQIAITILITLFLLINF